MADNMSRAQRWTDIFKDFLLLVLSLKKALAPSIPAEAL